MKKLFLFALTTSMIIISFSSCTKKPEKVAEEFITSTYEGSDLNDFIVPSVPDAMKKQAGEVLMQAVNSVKEKKLSIKDLKAAYTVQVGNKAEVKCEFIELRPAKDGGKLEEIEEDMTVPLIKVDGKWYIDLSDAISGYAEAASTEQGSENWDEILNSYEEFVDEYVTLLKKAKSGDMEASTKSEEVMKKVEELGSKLQKAEGSLSSSQASRFNKIAGKLRSAL